MKHKKKKIVKTKTWERLLKVRLPPHPPPPHRPHGPYIPRKKIKKDKLFFKQLRSSYLLGWEENISLFELVENKPHFLPLPSESLSRLMH